MTDTEDQSMLMTLTVEIVTAHVSNNSVPMSELPELIQSVHRALKGLSQPMAEPAQPERPQPAVPIKKSYTPDYIICLEDGRKLKTLKRHLRTAYNMTPEQYRERWGLPRDYPMVAPNYAAERSRLARESGLGERRRKTAAG